MSTLAIQTGRICRATTGVTMALLVSSPVHSFVQVQKQLDYNEQLQINERLAVCFEASQPHSKRLAGCSQAIEEADKGNLDKDAAARVYAQRALLERDDGDDRAALQDLNAAVKNDPKYEQAWLGRAIFYAAKGQYSDAQRDFAAAASINPKDPAVYNNRGNMLNAMGRHDEAIADFTRAIAVDPTNLVAYSNRATLYLTTGRFDLAAADFAVVIHGRPGDGMAYYNRGMAYERGGDRGKALEDYRTAMRLLPSFAPAAASLGRLLRDQDPDAAVNALSEAVRLDPRSPALRSRAILYLSMGRLDQALHDFDQVIANDGTDAIAYLDRGVTNEKLGRLDDAIRDYSRSFELSPTVAVQVDRGNAYASRQQPDQALVDFNAVLEAEPKNIAALLGVANAHYALKRNSASLEDYTRVIAADPKSVIAYFKRGNLHADRLEFDAAFSDYSASLKLDPNQAVVLYNRSLVAGRLGRRKEAAEDRRRALALDSTLADRDERPRH